MAFLTPREKLSKHKSKISSFDFALKDTHRGAAHFRSQSPAFCRDFHLDLARTPHFHSLRDRQSFRSAQLPVLHQVRAERPAGRTRCRVLDGSPRHHAAREYSAVATDSKTKSQGPAAGNQVSQRTHVHMNSRKHTSATHRNHKV